jgi:hypothetical protein
MATNPRKRQQKLERRAAKRKEKKHIVAREQQAGLGERLTVATKYPVLHAWVTDDLWEQGIGWVLLSRALPNGSIAVAVFLVDRYCLGVKNAMGAVVSRLEYDNRFVQQFRSQSTSQTVTPAKARKIVESAVEYARKLGFAPHADYQKAKLLFGTIDASECTEEIELGKDGKPLFINGPNESRARCAEIVATLARNCGEGNFHYLIGGPGGGPLAEEELEGLEFEEEDERR